MNERYYDPLSNIKGNYIEHQVLFISFEARMRGNGWSWITYFKIRNKFPRRKTNNHCNRCCVCILNVLKEPCNCITIRFSNWNCLVPCEWGKKLGLLQCMLYLSFFKLNIQVNIFFSSHSFNYLKRCLQGVLPKLSIDFFPMILFPFYSSSHSFPIIFFLMIVEVKKGGTP